MRMTHALVTASGLILLQGIGGAAGRAQSTDAKATAVLAQARKALGGEQKLAALEGAVDPGLVSPRSVNAPAAVAVADRCSSR